MMITSGVGGGIAGLPGLQLLNPSPWQSLPRSHVHWGDTTPRLTIASLSYHSIRLAEVSFYIPTSFQHRFLIPNDLDMLISIPTGRWVHLLGAPTICLTASLKHHDRTASLVLLLHFSNEVNWRTESSNNLGGVTPELPDVGTGIQTWAYLYLLCKLGAMKVSFHFFL